MRGKVREGTAGTGSLFGLRVGVMSETVLWCSSKAMYLVCKPVQIENVENCHSFMLLACICHSHEQKAPSKIPAKE